MRQLSRKEWPYQIRIPDIAAYGDPTADPKVKWLYDCFGARSSKQWNYVSIGPNIVYLFKNEQDHLLFTLRWM